MTSVDTWAEIYERHRSSLVAYVSMQLGSKVVAEDVVQDSITRLLASPHLEVEDPAAYLRVTVVNACRRAGRMANCSRPLDPQDLTPALDPAHIDLLDAVRRLSARRRTAVLLRYYLDLPVIEVAELMECKPSTVSSLLNRAHRDLKEHLP